MNEVLKALENNKEIIKEIVSTNGEVEDKYLADYFRYNVNHHIIEKQLTDLENIKQKYNIDLTTLFKAMENGAYFRNPHYRNEITYVGVLYECVDLRRKCFDIRMSYFAKPYDYCTGGYMFYFRDYGIKDEGGWALTREELENG